MNPRPPSTNLAYLLPICLVATLGGLLFGYDTGVISGAIEPLTARFGLGDFMKGWASGCVLVGCAAGVLLVGPISDRFGRKLAMFLAALMFLISAIGTAIPNDITTFILFRIVGGLGIGIASISTPMYIAEITPAHIRGRMVAVNQIAIVGGIAGTAFINYFIAHSQGDPSLAENQAWIIETGWRWMFGTGIAPSVLFAALLIPIPESPRWLIERRREDEAKRILEKVAGPTFAATEFSSIKAALSREQGTWGELFSRRLRVPLTIGIALAVLQQVTGINVFMYFGATIFKTMSANAGVDAGLLTQIIINGSCVVFIILYIACFGLSVGPVTWVILAEIFPTAVRGRALGLATFFLWTADYAVTQTFPMMDAKDSWFVKHFNHAFPFYTYAAFCMILILVVWRLLPETKGRSLEDIERSWEK